MCSVLLDIEAQYEWVVLDGVSVLCWTCAKAVVRIIVIRNEEAARSGFIFEAGFVQFFCVGDRDVGRLLRNSAGLGVDIVHLCSRVHLPFFF